MAGTSGKNLFCFLHFGGKFINGGRDKSQYVRGLVRTKFIKEGTTYDELRRIISSMIEKESNDIRLKFKVSFDPSTYVDLVDNEGVDHLIKFNEESGHVYIEEKGNNDNVQPPLNAEMQEEEEV